MPTDNNYHDNHGIGTLLSISYDVANMQCYVCLYSTISNSGCCSGFSVPGSIEFDCSSVCHSEGM